MNPYVFVLGAGVAALAAVVYLALLILRQDAGTHRMRQVAGYIESGANVYFSRQVKTIALVLPWLAVAIFMLLGWKTTLAFITGVALSLAAGFLGIRIAVKSNVRTASAAHRSIGAALRTAFTGGAVTGLSVTTLSLLALYALQSVFGDLQALIGFGFGGSLAALFAQIGGGIYTKSADVGADLVGKLEEGVPEDDPRNAAVVADLVGDNVGDCAGRGSDLFQSFSDDIITGMILGSLFAWKYGANAIAFPLVAQALGIVASLLGIALVIRLSATKPSRSLSVGLVTVALVNATGLYFLSVLLLGDVVIFLAGLSGLLAMLSTIFVVEYYTSPSRSPIRRMAEVAGGGAAINVIAGLSYGLQSSILPVLATMGAVVLSFVISGGSLFAIVATNIGTDLMTTFIMSSDAFGPITDNAEGVAKLSGGSSDAINALERLDAIGNTMKASTKAYAMASGTITALVTFLTYFKVAGISSMSMSAPFALAALFLGMALSYLFSSITISATAKGAFKVVDEVRRQFKAIAGLREGSATPDYNRCVDIATANALREMVLPSSIAFLVPVLIGVLFGPEELGALVVGAATSSALLGFFFNNAGAVLDNAKKLVESGFNGGNGSAAYKATVVGDTVGDPLKDVAGPSLLIFMKLMGMTSLLLLPLIRTA